MARGFRKAGWALALVAFGLGSAAHAALVDFESFNDGDLIVSEVPGVVVSGGTVLSAGIGLNELDFPPSSGFNVLAALSGPLTFNFGVAVTASAFLVSAEQVSVSAFDALGALLDTFDAPFASNLGAPQWVDFSRPGASRYALASAQPFVIDDLNFNAAPFGIPEPSSLALCVATLAALARTARRRPAQG